MARVLVVGAGIFGVTAALALRERGHEVVLTDPGPVPHPAASSTDISKAVRIEYGADEAWTALGEAALDGWVRWNTSFDRPLYHEVGMLLLARAPMRPGGFEHDSRAVLCARGHHPEVLDAHDLSVRHPAWDASVHPHAYFHARAGWVESGEVVRRLVDRCSAAGVEVRPGTRVTGLLGDGDVQGAITDEGGAIEADRTVVAAGAWTPGIVPWLAEHLTVVAQPVFHLRPADPAAFQPPAFPPWAADIANTGWYGFPANADGVVKIAHHGSGVATDPDRRPHDLPGQREPALREFLAAALPSLADAPMVGGRACLYTDTADGAFWIGADPDRPSLVVASGGSGHAFKFAPLLGRWIADAVEGVDDPVTAAFGWRSVSERRPEEARADG